MKKLITTVFFALLLLLVIPPALEGPVRSLLSALGAPAEHSRAIALALTGLGIFLFLDRKRIRARRQRRRERRAERRERERLRSSYVLNLSPYRRAGTSAQTCCHETARGASACSASVMPPGIRSA